MIVPNPEKLHVGRAMRQHTDMLGVTRSDLAAVMKTGSPLELRFAEQAQAPSLRVIRTYHDLVMTAYSAKPDALVVAVACREQWWVTLADHALWARARTRSRRCQWWWGPRVTDHGRGAWCWVCQHMIYTYDIGRGVTHNVRITVMEHRATHITAGDHHEHAIDIRENM